MLQIVHIKVNFQGTKLRSSGKGKGSPYNRPLKAQRVSRGIAPPFHDLGARWGGWSAPRPGRFTPGKNPVSIVQEAG